jgi:TonB family protein
VLEIRGGGGWLRTPRLFLNFRVTFEFKTSTPELDAGVLIRTWTGVGGWPEKGYRIRLPTDSAMRPSAVFVGHRVPVAIAEEGHTVLRPSGEWQQIEITGEGRRITCVMNGTLVAAADVDDYGGHVMFDNKKGILELRNIAIDSTETVFEMPKDVMTEKELKAAAGKAPKVISVVRPRYTMEAMRHLVQGNVSLEVVVLPDGSTGPMRIKHSLDPDLDLSAIAAVRAWKFAPVLVNGKPTEVRTAETAAWECRSIPAS